MFRLLFQNILVWMEDWKSDQFSSSFDHLTCNNQNMSGCQIFIVSIYFRSNIEIFSVAPGP